MRKKTYTPKEVAQMIEHDSSTVNRWCKEGKIAAKKPFGRWVITRGALLALLFAFGLLNGEGLREYRTMRESEELHARQALVGQDAVRKQVSKKTVRAAAAEVPPAQTRQGLKGVIMNVHPAQSASPGFKTQRKTRPNEVYMLTNHCKNINKNKNKNKNKNREGFKKSQRFFYKPSGFLTFEEKCGYLLLRALKLMNVSPEPFLDELQKCQFRQSVGIHHPKGPRERNSP